MSRIDRQGLDLNVLSDLENNIFVGKIDSESLDFVAYFEAILYFCTAFILFITTLYQTRLLIYDTFNGIYSILYQEERNNRVYRKLCQLQKQLQPRNGVKETPKFQAEKAKKQSPKRNSLLCSCCVLIWKQYIFCVGKCMKCYFKHIEPVYYVDSKWRMLSIILREWLEITAQIYALLLYGGVNVFALESNVLSQKAHIIEWFCIIVATNCITGIPYACINVPNDPCVVYLYFFLVFYWLFWLVLCSAD